MKTSPVQPLDQFSDNQFKQKLKPRHYNLGDYTKLEMCSPPPPKPLMVGASTINVSLSSPPIILSFSYMTQLPTHYTLNELPLHSMHARIYHIRISHHCKR